VNLQNYINAECMKTCVMTWSTVAVARDECAEARLAEEQITGSDRTPRPGDPIFDERLQARTKGSGDQTSRRKGFHE
jgi:hypothetical protein